MVDVNIAEQPATESSAEIKTTEPTTNEVVPGGEAEQKTVPYERFQEVVAQKNAYKELMETQGTAKTESVNIEAQAKQIAKDTGESYDDALALVKQIVNEEVNSKLSGINRQMSLDRAIREHPDFYQYKDQIKEVIKENPNLDWNQAYRLAKFPFLETKVEEVSKKEVQQNIEQKVNASVESASKQKATPGDISQINPLAKGPDGKFLYSTKELESILPKS